MKKKTEREEKKKEEGTKIVVTRESKNKGNEYKEKAGTHRGQNGTNPNRGKKTEGMETGKETQAGRSITMN
jgi:hypothetical protein